MVSADNAFSTRESNLSSNFLLKFKNAVRCAFCIIYYYNQIIFTNELYVLQLVLDIMTSI